MLYRLPKRSAFRHFGCGSAALGRSVGGSFVRAPRLGSTVDFGSTRWRSRPQVECCLLAAEVERLVPKTLGCVRTNFTDCRTKTDA
jgi:hypothetical protein